MEDSCNICCFYQYILRIVSRTLLRSQQLLLHILCNYQLNYQTIRFLPLKLIQRRNILYRRGAQYKISIVVTNIYITFFVLLKR